MSERENLELSELENVTGGYALYTSGPSRMEREAVVVYRPDVKEILFGGVNHEEVAGEISKIFGLADNKDFIRDLSTHLKDQCNKDPGYFQNEHHYSLRQLSMIMNKEWR